MHLRKMFSSLVTGVSLLALSIQYANAANYCTNNPVDGEVYKIVNVKAGLVLGAESDAKKAYLELQKDTKKDAQRFYLNEQSNNYWSLQAVNTDYAVTVESGSRYTGASLQQKPFSNSNSQEWELKKVTSGSNKGSYRLVNSNSSLTMTAKKASKGADIYQDDDEGESLQRWWLEPTSVGCSGSDSSGTDVTLKGTIGDGEITLYWNDSKTNSNYTIYQDTDSTPKGRKNIGKVSPSTLTYTVTGLKNGKTYYFWVKYKNSDGTSSDSSLFSGTPKAGSSGGGGGSSEVGDSSSAAKPTADAAKKAGANAEPRTNGYPSFIKNKVSGATVVSSASKLVDAIADAKAGDVIYIRKGTYKLSSTISITQSGSSSKAIVLSVYPGDDHPTLDFSKMSESSNNRGFDLKGNYWHFYGFNIKKAGDNGMYVRGSHNTIEFMKFYENKDTGLQLDKGAAYNFVKNSDSYYNADSSLENADGFAAKLQVGTGNYFYGCRAWQNLDDGFDGYLRDNGKKITTTWEYSWMIRNGYQKNGSKGVGDGNGFKTGGSDDKKMAHNGLYINTISAENTEDGYDQNSNRGAVTIYNALSYGNNRNYGLFDGSKRELKKLTIKNSISLDTNSTDKCDAGSTNISNNSWNGNSASSSDFVNLDVDQLLAKRQADGSLPIVKFGHLKSSSDLIDAGTDVGLDYNGKKPDLGPFESK